MLSGHTSRSAQSHWLPRLKSSSHNRPLSETYRSAFLGRGTPPPQAHDSLLTNLKSHLIIRISKGQTIDGEPETKGGGHTDSTIRM